MGADRSLADLVQAILTNIQEIIRAEMRLARVEVSQEASKALSSSLWIIVGAVSTLFAVAFALWTVAYAIGRIWPMWTATLIVTVGLGLTATVLVRTGLQRVARVHPTPERTVATIKENVAWVKQSTR